MTTNEIISLLEDNNYAIGGKDLLNVININENKELQVIEYHPDKRTYDMWDRNGNNINFKAIPLDEYNKSKVKRRKR